MGAFLRLYVPLLTHTNTNTSASSAQRGPGDVDSGRDAYLCVHFTQGFFAGARYTAPSGCARLPRPCRTAPPCPQPPR